MIKDNLLKMGAGEGGTKKLTGLPKNSPNIENLF